MSQGEIAQLVEQRTENSRVVGSIPTLATIFQADLNRPAFFVLRQGVACSLRRANECQIGG